MLGGYDRFLRTLLFFMAIDILTGWILAAVFKKSVKTDTGKMSSGAGFKGIFKKGGMLLMVMAGVLLDELIGTGELTRDAIIIAFLATEMVSITENLGLMGVKYPAPLEQALEILSSKRKP
jgi:toxin secretion/phage lysis holin